LKKIIKSFTDIEIMENITLKKPKLRAVKKQVLKDNKNKLVILEFTGSDCAYCKPQELVLQQLSELYNGDMAVFSLNTDDHNSANFKLGKVLDLRVRPSLLIFNGKYKIRYVLSGLIQKDTLEYIILNKDEKCCINCKKLKSDDRIKNFLFCKKYKEYVNFLHPDKKDTGKSFYCKIAKAEINYKPEEIVEL